MLKIIPILHNIRSLHNVGAILRTAEGLGLKEVWISGYTPYPALKDDLRLPHVRERATKQIAKTALGAEKDVKITVFSDIENLLDEAKKQKLKLIAVEQDTESINLDQLTIKRSTGVIFGNETEGIDKAILDRCNQIIEIPMRGKKESFNVSATAAMVLYTVSSQTR